LEREGRTVGNLDLMIAAQALAAELVLVSHDRAFRRIGRLEVEDWCAVT
jgi:predicted nucleic acid-binding protein